MHPIWTGLVSFGLVNIPIKLYSAVKSETFHFNYLRKNDLCSIQYKKVCRDTGEEVPKDEIVRGYQYQKGDYVVLDDEDFKKAYIQNIYSINIELFVDEKEISPKYFEKSYYLEPEKNAEKTYILFREAMIKSKKVGVGKFVLKDREHLVLLRPDGNAITLFIMRFPEVIMSPDNLNVPSDTKVSQNHMKLALELIENLSGHFQEKDFKDTYNDRLKEIIESKKKGKTVHIEVEKPIGTEPSDLLMKLKNSLTATKKHIPMKRHKDSTKRILH